MEPQGKSYDFKDTRAVSMSAEELENYGRQQRDPAKKQLDDELANIDDMLKSKVIDQEKADKYRQEVRARAQKAMGAAKVPDAPKPQPTVNSTKIDAAWQQLEDDLGEAYDEFVSLTPQEQDAAYKSIFKDQNAASSLIDSSIDKDSAIVDAANDSVNTPKAYTDPGQLGQAIANTFDYQAELLARKAQYEADLQAKPQPIIVAQTKVDIPQPKAGAPKPKADTTVNKPKTDTINSQPREDKTAKILQFQKRVADKADRMKQFKDGAKKRNLSLPRTEAETKAEEASKLEAEVAAAAERHQLYEKQLHARIQRLTNRMHEIEEIMNGPDFYNKYNFVAIGNLQRELDAAKETRHKLHDAMTTKDRAKVQSADTKADTKANSEQGAAEKALSDEEYVNLFKGSFNFVPIGNLGIKYMIQDEHEYIGLNRNSDIPDDQWWESLGKAGQKQIIAEDRSYQDWWHSLSNDAKQHIIDFYNKYPLIDSKRGQALRDWMRKNNLLGTDTADPNGSAA